MTTQNTGIGAITLRTMRTELDEAAAIARAAEGMAADNVAEQAVLSLDRRAYVLRRWPLRAPGVGQMGSWRSQPDRRVKAAQRSKRTTGRSSRPDALATRASRPRISGVQRTLSALVLGQCHFITRLRCRPAADQTPA
jgi:hypothetical protein